MKALQTLCGARRTGQATAWFAALSMACAVAVAYFLAHRLGRILLSELPGVTVFRPATGFAVGILVTLGWRARPSLLIGVVAGTIAAGLMGGKGLWAPALKGVSNAGAAFLAAWLLERWFGSAFSFRDLGRVVGFLVAAGLAAAASGAGGAATKAFFHATGPFWEVWRTGFLSDAVGIVVVAPLVISLGQLMRQLQTGGELIEGAAWLFILTLTSAFLAVQPPESWLTFSAGALVLPLLLWLTARYQPTFAIAGAVVVSMTIISAIAFGVGRFGDAAVPLIERVQGAQTAVVLVTVYTLLLAALFSERRSREVLLEGSIERLRTQEKAFRQLLGSLPAAIYTTDKAGRITYCNQAAVELWGTRPELGKDKWSDLWHLHYPDGTSVPLDDRPTQIVLNEGRAVRGREALLERPDGTLVPIMPCPAPLIDERSAVIGVVNMQIDLTERKRAEAALAERDAQLTLASKVARVGSYTFDCVTGIVRLSSGCAAIYGLPEGTTELARADIRAYLHPDDLQSLDQEFGRAYEEQRNEVVSEYRILRADNREVRWIEARSIIAYGSTGKPLRRTGITIDVTERKLADDQKSLLLAELDHRVKNVLACVAAIAERTRDSSRSADEFLVVLNGRIQSLAYAHTLLSRSRWQGVSLAELVRAALTPCMTNGNTVIRGADIDLTAEATQVVAMVLHELTTNAAKYGALSNCRGRVSACWEWQSHGKSSGLTFEWRETGGPHVVPPGGSGYGTTVIRDLIPYELGGSVDYVLAPEGARCRMLIPARWLRAGAATPRFGLPTETASTGERQPSP